MNRGPDCHIGRENPGVRELAKKTNGAVKRAPLGSQKPKGLAAAVQRTVVKLRRILGADIQENAAEAREAVAHFLDAMKSVAARTYPAWNKILMEGLADRALDYDERRALLDVHPIDDYFFAGVVALDAVRIRTIYTPEESQELLGEIGAQVDAAAGRQDRVVSDLVFLMISRIGLGAGVDLMKTPYDKVVKTLLQQLGIHKIDTTKALMRDKGFRHLLGEPLARGVPQWWRDFHTKFSLYWDEPEEMDDEEIDEALRALAAATAAPTPARRRVRRRASSILGDT